MTERSAEAQRRYALFALATVLLGGVLRLRAGGDRMSQGSKFPLGGTGGRRA
jgi:hypothetical protein